MGLFFRKSGESALPDGVWPRAQIVAALKSRYGDVDELGEERGFGIYGVSDGDIRFAVVLALVEGAPDKVGEVGFLARFIGFDVGERQIESVNRNLHISIASLRGDGELYLIGGVAASGVFNESSFMLILEAWRRDLLVLMQSLAPARSLADAHPAAKLQAAARFAMNRAPAEAARADEIFAAFAGGAHRAKAVCDVCNGRGKTGFFARLCPECDGTGFEAAQGR
ncbi:MAG: hypothetical protein R3C42_08955 [Parvularculaceae bacterium]|nr:zinc finger-like domain-containing protein [Parvularculaceae bacterium]